MLKAHSGNAHSMKSVKDAISACRHCRFYQIEGRRGGDCQQLGVPVQGSWKACSLAAQPFASQWDDWSEVVSRRLSSPDPQTVVASEISLQMSIPEFEPVTPTALIEEILLTVE